MPFSATTLALAFSAALSTAAPTPAPAPTPLPKVETIRERVEVYFADAPIMAAIASCESHYRQFNKDGSVFRGIINNKDVGVMQINEHYHLETATKMGLDIHTIEGNLAYGRHLYEQEGTTPWLSSSPCWLKSKHARDLAFNN